MDVVDIAFLVLLDHDVKYVLEASYLELVGRILNYDLASLCTCDVRDLECAGRYFCICISEICLAVGLIQKRNDFVYHIHSALSFLSEDHSVDRLEYDTLIVDVLDLAESVSCRVVLDLLRSKSLLDVLPCGLGCSE